MKVYTCAVNVTLLFSSVRTRFESKFAALDRQLHENYLDYRISSNIDPRFFVVFWHSVFPFN